MILTTAEAEAVAYFKADTSLITEPGSGYKPFARTSIFWGDRAYFDDQSKNGDRREALKMYAAMVANGPVCLNDPNDQSDWNIVGPLSQPTQFMGIIISLWVNPANQNEVFAGSNSGGLFKTSNGGTTWVNVTESSNLPALGIRSILVRGSGSSRTIFIATGTAIRNAAGFGIGVYRSDDEGASWQPTGLSYSPSQILSVSSIFPHPTDPNTLFALTDDGLVRSTDSFATYTLIGNPPGAPDAKLNNYAFKQNNASVLYLGGAGVWKITFSGGSYTWSSTFPFPVSYDTNGSIFWAYLSQAANGDVYCLFKNSVNDDVRCDRMNTSETWSFVSDPNIASTINVSCYAVNPDDPNVMYAGANTGLQWFRKSTNSGASWSQRHGLAPNAIHPDSRVLSLLPSTNSNNLGTTDVLYLGNDGGVSRTTTGGDNLGGVSGWTNINGTGLSCTQFYGIAGSDQKSDLVMGGAQDNGIFSFADGQWTRRDAGDAYDVVIERNNPNKALTTTIGSSAFLRTLDMGGSWQGSGVPSSENRHFDQPLEGHPNNAIYAAFENIHRIDDVANIGGTTTTLSNFVAKGVGANSNIGAFAVAPSDENTIYAAFRDPDDNGTGKRFWRTTTAGGSNQQDWTDLTSFFPPENVNNSLHLLRFFEVTDIAVDPENSLRLWVSLCGFSTQARVVFSSNGGNSWTEVGNTGLPSDGAGEFFQINHLEYREGSDDQIFAATDAGVFYIEDGATEWQCFNNDIAIGVVQDLDIDYCTSTLRASVYGRGVWESPLPVLANTPIKEVTQSQTWDVARVIPGDLVVRSGVTLTVKQKILMTPNGKIIVEPNAKLIIDGLNSTNDFEGGKVTCSCDSRWDGIYVSGKSTASQSSSPSLFGKLVLKNGSKLENAIQAVNNFGLTSGGSLDWAAIGGIVQADDAVFYNNVHGARFMAYTNTHRGNPVNDKSYFRKCDFSVDDDMINGDYLYAFIEQWKTRGIDIFGCNFTNTQTAFEIDRGIGVFNQEAKCTITDHCNGTTYPCPTASQVHSTFTGLRYGVNVSGTGNGLAVTSVYNAVFTNNPWGIYSGSSDDTKVVGCTFDVNGTDGPIGIYLENSPITDIYGNEFNSAGVSPTNIPAGIVAEDLGQTATPIYNNTFNDLAVGCSAQGGNKNGLQGLQFLCNDYNDNLFAISVVNLTPKVGAQGIAAFQGSNGDGAGNRFYNSGLYDYINSAQTEAIVYWHNTATGNPIVPTTSGVFYLVDAGVTVAQDDCNIGSGGKSTLMAEYQEANDQLVVKQAELDAITDNGSTEDALQDVTLAGVGEELQLRNQLLQRSPNVSEEVLKATVEKPAPLPNAMLRDVLAANPQAGKNKQVMDAVDMLPIPMDEYMVEQIAEAAYSISPKEKKAGEVASAHRKREHLAHQVLMELMHDTIKYNPKAAKAFLREKNDLYADLELMKIHASEKNTPGMDEVAERIASRELSESEAARLQGYADYRNLEKELIAEGKNWLQADEQTIAQLWDLSVDENIAGQYAQNILEFMGLAEFEKKLIVPVMQPQGKKADQSNRANTVGYVKVQPVPAREYVVVKYDVRHLGDGVVFELLEATGKPMLSRTLQNTLDETVIDLRGIKAGNYAYRVMHNGRMHYSGKVVVAD